MGVTGAKRGKTWASKSRFVLVLLLIGLKSGASFANQSQNEVKANANYSGLSMENRCNAVLRRIELSDSTELIFYVQIIAISFSR